MATLQKADLAPLALLELGAERAIAAVVGRGTILVIGGLPEDPGAPPIRMALEDAGALGVLVEGIGQGLDMGDAADFVRSDVRLPDGSTLVAVVPPPGEAKATIVRLLPDGEHVSGGITCDLAEVPRLGAWLVEVARQVARPSTAAVH